MQLYQTYLPQKQDVTFSKRIPWLEEDEMPQDADDLKALGKSLFGGGNFEQNIVYFQGDRILGEIDLVGLKGKLLYVLEYKSSDTKSYRKKAKEQLLRVEQYVMVDGSPYALFYAYPVRVDGQKGFHTEHLKSFDGKRFKDNTETFV